MQLGAIPLAQLGVSAVNAAGTLGTALVRRAAARITSSDSSSEPSRAEPPAEEIAGYDVHKISPREFSALIERLYDWGAISQAELEDLMRIRQQLDTDGFEPDELLDLVEYFEHELVRLGADPLTDEAGRSGDSLEAPDTEAAELARRQLNWIYRLTGMQSGRSRAIDTLA